MVKQDPDVAIVVPMRNEEKTIVRLLESFEKLTLYPKEIILVDGGSSDRTVAVISRYAERGKFPYSIHVVTLSHALPGRGRNEGIRKTHCPIVACTDVGSVDPFWLEDLVTPFRTDPSCEIVIGTCKPQTDTFFEHCTFYVTVESLFRKEFIFLGGDSLAFRKELWEKVGGYSEHLYPCEDKEFLKKVKQKGCRFFLSDRAIVYWKSRSTLRGFFKQYFLYGRGDGEGHFVPCRYLLRFLFYGALLLFFLQNRGVFAASLLAAYLGLLTVKGWRTLKDIRVFLYLPVLFLLKDISQLLGYPRGFLQRRHVAPH